MSITIELPTPGKAGTLEIPNDGTRVYRYQCYHKCRKTCSCNAGRGHGPYWRACWRERKDGKVKQINKYLGKSLEGAHV